MRIFSDTPRDRPVFDAYPLPQSTDNLVPPAMSAPGANGQPSSNNTRLSVSRPSTGINSAFQYPLDGSNMSFQFSTDVPTYNPPPAPTPNPVVENMLASYFPTTQNQGQSQDNPMMAQGDGTALLQPEDFLSQVFNFGWDPAGNVGMANGVPINQDRSIEQMDALGFAGTGPYETWNSHGWMA